MRRLQGSIINAEPSLLTWILFPTLLYRLTVNRIKLQSWHSSTLVPSSEILTMPSENSIALQYSQHHVSMLDFDKA